MRLQLDMHNIKDIQFADKTVINDGVLKVNRKELQGLLETDKRFSKVNIELVHPGEKCRILQVYDVFEPRAKTKGSGEDFPGVLGRQSTIGDGSTCVLRGAAVVISEYSKVRELLIEPNGEIIDMSGPGAELSPYGKTHNVVLLPSPAEGVSVYDYAVALKIAGLKTAVYLAQAGKDLKPDEMEVYELPPLLDMPKETTDLLRVAYIFQLLSAQWDAIHEDPVLYGSNARRTMPFILHPNEVMDGAVLTQYRAWGMDTYSIQNHPIIKELYRRHGKDLCFTGVIINIVHDNEPANERASNMVANLAKWVLGANGVILTKCGGGATEPALARTAQRCEEVGLKTSLAFWHVAFEESDGTSGGRVIFNMPELGAIVSMGIQWEAITLPPVGRIIGTPFDLPGGIPVDGEIKRVLRYIRGAQDQLGSSRLVMTQY